MPRFPSFPRTVARCDAQAAFRQGAEQLYQHYEPVADADKDTHTAALKTASFNFEFARVIL
jgi:hypothetical protein